ncbi:hypothetical protein Micbo1qcDRAFT_193644 [Microdochium bolleyi]|uniref:Cytoplasmic tRNA 2-thiolation protein 2 n=1 Tax=Microdochium bolleyi TaxID=196109 RepID=A0A136JBG0_9PEZI|nr:hypothetical protein Micbo1qcDRAFT_193644 [Microdochium bolleyi]
MSSSSGLETVAHKDTAMPCIRCKAQPAAHDLRSETVCTSCFIQYIQNKAIKRLELLQRETRGLRLPSKPQRYLLALSGGPSSACLLDVLHDNVLQQRARGQRVKFELLVVHVSDDDVEDGASRTAGRAAELPGQEDEKDKNGGGRGIPMIDRFRERFPEVEILDIPLSKVLELDTIDWSALPATDVPITTSMTPTTTTASPETGAAPQAQQQTEHETCHNQSLRLAYLFSQLPSATSRADVRRLLTRHLLITTAVEKACDVLLLGYNTTSLAELTLSETAKGRGFALPWMINDGAVPLPRSIIDGSSNGSDLQKEKQASGATGIPIYSPLRDIYRKELFVYLTSTPSPSPSSQPPADTGDTAAQPPLSALIPPHLLPAHLRDPSSAPTPAAVVSHRDLSIDDVMARYFADVEANYPSVVANVVRTTGKLSRLLSGADTAHEHEHHVDTSLGGHTTVEAGGEDGVTPGDAAAAAPRASPQQKPGSCGICGLQLDEHGNERWRGEIGESDAATGSAADGALATTTITSGTTSAQQQQQHRQNVRGSGRLCYGCERAILG